MDAFGLEKLGFRNIEIRLVPAYMIVNVRFSKPIDIEKVVKNNTGINYDFAESGRGGQRKAVLKTEHGTLLIARKSAQMLHVSDPNAIRFLGEYLRNICNCSEKRSFKDWLKNDWRKFINEDLEWPKFLEEIGVRRKNK
jgi:hypothetical protein